MSGTALKAADDEGSEVPPGERGEFCVKGPQVMKGYRKRPEATAEILCEEGWLKTGDVAIIDEEGYVRIVDRVKDMVLASGFNVYPDKIENVVARHEKVQNCDVIGVPDDKTDEGCLVPDHMKSNISGLVVSYYARLSGGSIAVAM